MSRKLTIGMRCRFKSESHWAKDWDWAGQEVLLKERSGGEFSVMVLGQKELKREDPKTIDNEVAWVTENELEFVDDNFKANLEFMDWYQEHEDEFCSDCGAWFPDNGRIDPATDEDFVCPNKDCPGRLYDSGLCPCCKTPAPKDGDICPECDFNWQLRR